MAETKKNSSENSNTSQAKPKINFRKLTLQRKGTEKENAKDAQNTKINDEGTGITSLTDLKNIKEIETAANIKLDDLFSGAVKAANQPQNAEAANTGNTASENAVVDNNASNQQQAEPPAAGQEGAVPPVTNQSEGTNQGGGVFTTGSGN